MLKRLLTLLAILSGLAAMGAPAHARYSAAQDVGFHASGEDVAKCQGQRLAQRMLPFEKLSIRKGEQTRCAQPVITIVIPTVQLHADRSRQ